MTKNELIAASQELDTLLCRAKEILMKIQDAAPILSTFEIGNVDSVDSLVTSAIDECEHMTGNIRYSLNDSLERK